MSKTTITTCDICGEQTTKKMPRMLSISLYVDNDLERRQFSNGIDMCAVCKEKLKKAFVESFDKVVEQLITDRKEKK